MRLKNKHQKSGKKTTIPPLRKNRDFMLLWSGVGLALFGRQVGFIAFPLLMIWQEGSTVDAGLVSFAGLLPTLLVQLPAGVIVDRWDRRLVMIGSDIAGAVSMGSVGLALAFGHVWLALVMAAAFIEGSAAIFYRIAEQAAVRNVVHPSHLSSAISQNEARGRAATLLGQPAGSALFALTRWLPFGIAALGHIIALVNLLLIRVKFQVERTTTRRSLRSEMAEGFTWIWGQKFVRAAIICVAGSNLLFQVLTLTLYVIIKNHGGSTATVGAIGVVMGVGGVAGALSGPWCMKRLNATWLIIGSLAAWTALIAPMAFTANPVTLGVLFAGTTFVGGAMNVGAGSIMIRIMPDEIRGRATSIAFLLASGANSIGALAAGFLLTSYTTTNVVLGVSAAMLVVTLISSVTPAIRHPDIPLQEEEGDESTADAKGDPDAERTAAEVDDAESLDDDVLLAPETVAANGSHALATADRSSDLADPQVS